ncbi:MAG: tetratricopeptide repeat protein [Methanothrix sp.]|nr:tetratricopeptide repeat protein [Methanothrix sp.]
MLGLGRETLCILENPENARAWEGKGRALYKMGRYEEAIEAFNRSIELCPLDPDAWQGKGEALQALGERFEGRMAMQLAKKLEYQE